MKAEDFERIADKHAARFGSGFTLKSPPRSPARTWNREFSNR